MSKSANTPSTDSSSETKTPVVIQKTKRNGHGNETIIHNDSAKNIFLIPVRRTWKEASPPQGKIEPSQGKIEPIEPSQGKIEKSMVEMIPKGGKKTVSSSKYDLNPLGSTSQIYILFRAGDADNEDKFLEELGTKQGEQPSVTLEEGEKFRLHSQLFKKDLRLNCLERPVTGDSSAGQVSEKDKKGEKNKQSNQCPELNSPSDELQALKEEVEDLKKNMETLKRHFESFVEGLMKCCDPLRANTHSSSN